MSEPEFFDTPGYGEIARTHNHHSQALRIGERDPAHAFEAKKVIVVGGSAGIGRQAAVDVVDHGGSAVIVGRSKARVDDTVAELASRGGEA